MIKLCRVSNELGEARLRGSNAHLVQNSEIRGKHIYSFWGRVWGSCALRTTTRKYQRKPREFSFENSGIYDQSRQSNPVAVDPESRDPELVRGTIEFAFFDIRYS